MRPLNVQELADLLGGSAHEEDGALVYGFATDSNQVRAGDAFMAIRGAKVDGHEFVPAALKNGAVVAIVEHEVEGPHILVPNLVQALAKFGSHFRGQFEGPVIGVTGSAGKTTTKEFLASGLSSLGKVLKTEGNRNTEYTAPLLWAELEPDTKVVAVEMAMRGFDQISHLASFSKPTIGVITNIGFGHLEMVGSREGIARAKGELLQALPPDGLAIVWQEDDFLQTLRQIAEGRRVRTFGYSEEADCRITHYKPLDWHRAEIRGELDGTEWVATVPVVGRHIALNVAAAVLAAASVGVDPAEAALHMRDAALPPMRMEVREINGASLLMDTYNASPPAMFAAIDTLSEMPVEGRRLAVVGEMKELGEHTERLHREVGRELARLDEVMFYGEPMATWAREEALKAGLKEAHVATSREDVTRFLETLQPGDAALLKGSRALELEKTVEVVTG
jgi:UDP-N-acetylmuramoyl-tripeptide--D-alanyl-D-alanine ligase